MNLNHDGIFCDVFATNVIFHDWCRNIKCTPPKYISERKYREISLADKLHISCQFVLKFDMAYSFDYSRALGKI